MSDGELTGAGAEAGGDSTAGDDGSAGDAEGSASEETAATVSLTVDGEDVTVAIPASADHQEAAAIATAVGAHLHDRAAAAAAAASDESDEPPEADAWKLAGRMKSFGRSRWPDDVREGEEWQAAARSFY